MAQTMASRVREYVSGLTEFRSNLVVDQFPDLNAKVVRNIIHDMVKRGELAKLTSRSYRFIEFRSAKSRHLITVRPMIYRAIHVRGGFTTADIAKLTDVDRDYVRKVLNRLVLAGDLERVGEVQKKGKRREWTYRVRHRDRFFLKYVRGNPSV